MTRRPQGTLAPILALLLAACGSSADEPADDSTSGGEEIDLIAEAEMEAATRGETLDGGEGVATDAGNETGDTNGAETDAVDVGEASEADGGAPEAGDAGDPEAQWRQRLARGRSVFRQACDTCHPGGEADLGPTLRGIGWNVEAMERQIRRGSGRMRPITPAQLPDRYMGDLMAYLTRFGAVRGVQRP